ncbi:MAG: hypothetical protein ABR601_04565 [Parasphingopyxis sp.]
MSLLIDIDRFLRKSGMKPTSFGRAAVNDPRFVFDLRRGRTPGPGIRARTRAFIAACRNGNARCG